MTSEQDVAISLLFQFVILLISIIKREFNFVHDEPHYYRVRHCNCK